MESDLDLKNSINRLKEIALGHSNGICMKEELDESREILSRILKYAHKMSTDRQVQIFQMEENKDNIQKILNQSAKEGNFPIIANHIDNLLRYCGARI